MGPAGAVSLLKFRNIKMTGENRDSHPPIRTGIRQPTYMQAAFPKFHQLPTYKDSASRIPALALDLQSNPINPSPHDFAARSQLDHERTSQCCPSPL
jgi:hypothetical protein